MKRAIISVSNDLSTDQRVQRSIGVLRDAGYEVTFVGRLLPESKDFNPGYPTKRFRLWFRRGWAFYAHLNLSLFIYLLFKRVDLLWANDLDTLLPNFLVARLRGKELIYDSHEYFCGVPEIQGRPLVKRVWQSVEAWIFPRLKRVITVNESIADLYERDYGIRPKVVRNIASSYLPERFKSRQELGLPESAYLVINQGSGINIDRGMEEFLAAMTLLPEEVHFLLVGKGDVIPQLKKLVQEQGLQERVHFIPPQPYIELLQYTAAADLGISLDKDTNINYRYSLPNKIFDYIKCGIPLLISDLKEPKRIVLENGLGKVCSHDAQDIAEKVLALKAEGKEAYRQALAAAAQQYNWERERQVIRDLLPN